MKFTIKHLKNYLDGKYDEIPKSLGVELVELGFCKYKKLTEENYNYWWYEVSDKSKIDRKAFTFDWLDIVPTKKMEMIKEYIIFHKDNENMYKLITAILNIESARFDGIDINTGKSEYQRLIEFYYPTRQKPNEQMQLFFKCA